MGLFHWHRCARTGATLLAALLGAASLTTIAKANDDPWVEVASNVSPGGRASVTWSMKQSVVDEALEVSGRRDAWLRYEESRCRFSVRRSKDTVFSPGCGDVRFSPDGRWVAIQTEGFRNNDFYAFCVSPVFFR